MNDDYGGAADAVLHVDDAGAVTLFIGSDADEPVAEAHTNSAVIRILLEHAEELDRPVTVATHYPSGHRTLHRFDPDGTVTMVQIAMPRPANPNTGGASGAPPARSAARGAIWAPVGPDRWRARPASMVGMLALLLAILMLTGADRASMPFAGAEGDDQAFGSDVLTDRTELFLPFTDDESSDRSPHDPHVAPMHASPSGADPNTTPVGDHSGHPAGGQADPCEGGPTDHSHGFPGGNPDGGPSGSPGKEADVPPHDGSASPPDGDTSSPPDNDPNNPPDNDPTRPPDDPSNPPDDDPSSPPDDDPTKPPGDPDEGEQDPPGHDPDAESPARPGSIGVTSRTGRSLSVSWSPATDNVGVTGYAVYVDRARVQTVSGTSTTVSGLTPATPYEVSVEALDAAGNMSGRVSVRGTTLDTVSPGPPTNLAGRAGLLSVDLSWEDAVDNVEVVSYAVYLDGDRARTTTSTDVTINGLLGGVLHTFSVAAIDSSGNLSQRVNVKLGAKLL